MNPFEPSLVQGLKRLYERLAVSTFSVSSLWGTAAAGGLQSGHT